MQRVNRDQSESRARQDYRVHQGRKDQSDPQAKTALLVVLGQLVAQDHKDKEEARAHLGHQAHKDLSVLRALKDLQVQQVPLVQSASLEIRDWLGLLDSQVLSGKQVHLVQLDHLAV